MTRRTFIGTLSACTLVGVVSVAGLRAAQAPAAATPATILTVTGGVAPVALTPADLKAFPRTRVEVKDEGRTIAYEGVLVSEVLRRVGAPLAGELRGNALTTYVVASATDGYQVVFSLAELDPQLTGSEIIVADTVDGRALLEHQGPLRIVAPKDSRSSRSIRMLERLELVRVLK